MIKFQINFDGDLEYPVYTSTEFNDLESATQFLDAKTDAEIHALYLEWCTTNEYPECGILELAEFDRTYISIDELEVFEPTVDAEDVLEIIADALFNMDEYAQNTLRKVKLQHVQELDAVLNTALKNWFETHSEYKPKAYKVIATHPYGV